MKFKHSISKFNRIILALVFFDFLLVSAFGIVAPFFAIFITEAIPNGTATVAGIATAIYWIMKSLVQLPIARWLDRTDGERDEFWAFFWGSLATALVPLLYLVSHAPWHIYAAQAFFGLAMAFVVPAWYSIFTRHIDRDKIGFEWSLDSVFSVGIASAISAAIGGWFIDRFGFTVVFVIASAVTFIASLFTLTIKNKIFSSQKPAAKNAEEKFLKKTQNATR